MYLFSWVRAIEFCKVRLVSLRILVFVEGEDG